ncbi:MAG: hypothetical protein ACREO0_01015, partial [Pseudoxanthomonas sp.]
RMIEFEDLGGGDAEATGTGTATLRLRARGFAVAGTAWGVAVISLVATSVGPPGEAPEDPSYAGGSGLFNITAAGYSPPSYAIAPAAGEAVLGLRARGFAVPNHGEARIRLVARGSQFYDPSIGSDTFAILAADNLALGASPNVLYTMVVEAMLLFNESTDSRFDGTVHADDTLAFGAELSWTALVLAESGLVLSAAGTASYQALAHAISRIVLSGQATSFAEALVMVIDSLVFTSTLEAMQAATASDTLVLGEVVATFYQMVVTAVDNLLLASTAAGVYQAFAVVRDSLVFGGQASHAADLGVIARDAISFSVSLTIDNGEYIAWVINLEGDRALSRYTDYPFNSFAKIGGKYYGASSSGLYRLEGESDDGEDINWKLRMGLQQMGDRRLKRIPEAYVGWASNGTMLIKVITVGEDGNKGIAIYRMASRGANANATAPNRRKFGKGLSSVDWDFILESVDGSTLDLKAIQFRPLILDRRTRG